MTAYAAVLGMVLVFGLLSRECRFQGKDYLLPVCALFCLSALFVIAALRGGSVGADTDAYQWIYRWIGSLDFSQLFTASGDSYLSQGIEPGYKLYNWVLYQIFPYDQAITIVNSMFLMLFVTFFIVRESRDPWLSVLLFLCLGLYQSALNLTPSAIATALVLTNIGFVRQGKFFKFLAVCLVAAFFFHLSALLFILLYFVYRVPIRRVDRFLLIFAIGMVVCLFAYPLIASVLAKILPASYQQYLVAGSNRPEQLLVWAFYSVLAALCLVLSRKKVAAFVQANIIHVWNYVFMSLAYALSWNNPAFARLSLILSMMLVVSIPSFISKFPKNRERASSNLFCSVYDRASFYIVTVATLGYLMRLMVNNIGSTIPYEFFWKM